MLELLPACLAALLFVSLLVLALLRRSGRGPDDRPARAVTVVGVYPIEIPGESSLSDVYLIEVTIDENDPLFDVGGFSQEEPGQPEANWQAAYDEQYLNEDGTEVVGRPALGLPLRFAFYLHFVRFDSPLLTPYYPVRLPGPVDMPERLKTTFTYEPPD